MDTSLALLAGPSMTSMPGGHEQDPIRRYACTLVMLHSTGEQARLWMQHFLVCNALLN